ncbi:glycerate kinase [Algoriphagus confluentis]|uniref:Glycerate kinase n=1 Tax=Algoriphagus confluentis TaxID=1697556 RepID=A0ABQ6PKS1_9BACT|nr:glycerate kinase [Algoriphagus confluentis]
MRFLIAPNAFKGTITAQRAAQLIQKAIEEVFPASQLVIQPIADGGDGTCQLLLESLHLEKVSLPALNAIGQPCLGFFGWDEKEKKAFLDVSTCSGLGVLADEQKDPWLASTFGTGLMIHAAQEMGAEKIVLGLGGSATMDLGTGILAALGFEFLDEKGRNIPMYSPGWMTQVKHIQSSIPKPKLTFTCLCDVQNMFYGPEGAISVFGPQKGLKPKDRTEFEKAASDFHQLLVSKARKEKRDNPGFGAAGGIAMGLSSFFDVIIDYGAAYFFEQVRMEEKIQSSDWIVTGEGKYDQQSTQGKGSFELLQLAKKYGKRSALITSGGLGESSGFDLVLNLPDLDFKAENLEKVAESSLLNVVKSALQSGGFD